MFLNSVHCCFVVILLVFSSFFFKFLSILLEFYSIFHSILAKGKAGQDGLSLPTSSGKDLEKLLRSVRCSIDRFVGPSYGGN